MISKKAQGEIITTVLIILVVLAAVVIVWQVVNGTIRKGSDAITAQTTCMGLTIDIVVNGTNYINIRPSKDIGGYKIYRNGAQLGTGGGNISSFSTGSSNVSAGNVSSGDIITVAGKIGNQWCEGANSVVAH